MANKTMHHVVIGSDTFEIVDQYAREHGVTIDSTLTQSGQAADAKAVGDAIANITIEVDDTLSEQGKAADAKAVGDALDGLDDRITSIGFTIAVDSNGNATIIRSDMTDLSEVNF